MATRLRTLVIAVLAASLAICLGSGAASAATRITVTTPANNGPTGGDCTTADTSCSLRQAFYSADGLGAVTIVLPAGTYVVSGLASQNAAITLEGAGAASTIIDGGGSTGTAVLSVNSGSLAARGVTIQNGSDGGVVVAAPASAALTDVIVRNNSTADSGAGIALYGSATLDHTQVSGNVASGALQSGGGILVSGTSGRTNRVSITNSTITDNQAGYGGGIEQFVNSSTNVTTVLSIAGSLISGNNATQSGGGFGGPGPSSTNTLTLSISSTTIQGNGAAFNGGGVSLGGQVQKLTGTTITGNHAKSGGNVVVSGAPSPAFQNTIVADGTATDAGPDCSFVSSATLVSIGHNLDDRNGCTFGPGDLVNTDPKLGPLADNGGPTRTRATALDSPVIDAGGTSCPSTDQRGVAAPQGAACDIGAYESAPATVVGAVASAVSSNAASITASVANPDTSKATVVVRWGTTAGAYGSSTPVQPAAPLTGPTGHDAALTGLDAGVTYHYVVSVTGTRGTATSADGSFTTTTAATAGGVPAVGVATGTAIAAAPASIFSVSPFRVARTGTLTAMLTASGAGTVRTSVGFVVTTKVKVKHHGKASVKTKRRTVTFGVTTARLTAKGAIPLSVKVSKAAAAKLATLKQARLTVTVTFTPTGGKAAPSQVQTLTVHRSRTGRYS